MTACGIPWPVCPVCPGSGLTWTRGTARCRRCGREWPVEERDPCPDEATVLLAATDATDPDATDPIYVCESHAAHPSAAALTRVPRP